MHSTERNISNAVQGKPIKCYNCNGISHDNVVDEDVDEPPVQDLALNVDNVFQVDDCDAFDSDVFDDLPHLHINHVHIDDAYSHSTDPSLL
ncbi:hypothetical protein Tco_0976440 [Tanacetum coccineum]|uniref:Uncharacterized protein n=1 Tax=Tanacetum coccineum TaxID=301880 RepID=A0ABQ5EH99_9ASTR